MTLPNDDMLAKRLAELPEAQIDPRVSAAVRRQARAALEESPSVRFTRLWASVMLPALLVGCAVVYAVDAAAFLERTYVVTASR
jgi:hypothetical protein